MEDGVGARRSWDALPEELLEKILSLLSVASLAQVRSVCKTWNRMVKSGSVAVGPQHAQPWLFLHCLMDVKPRRYVQEPWLGDVHGGGVLRGFDPVSSRWFGFSLPTAEKSLVKLCNSLGGYSGLLLLVEQLWRDDLRVNSEWHYWVGNPLLQSWQLVPPNLDLPAFGHYRHQLMVDENTKAFKILCFEFTGNTVNLLRISRVHIYDSCEGPWRREASTWLPPEGEPLIVHRGGYTRAGGYAGQEYRYTCHFSFGTTQGHLGPRILECKGDHESGILDVTTFAQDQRLGQWNAVKERKLVFTSRFPLDFPWTLEVAGNLERLYVGAINCGPDSPADFFMHDSSGWTELPKDAARLALPVAIAGTEASMPRVNLAVNASKAHGNPAASDLGS